MTNAEWIRSMSDEELGALLESFNACSSCQRRGNNCFPVFDIDEWLKQIKIEE